jgi:hypothetical protein
MVLPRCVHPLYCVARADANHAIDQKHLRHGSPRLAAFSVDAHRFMRFDFVIVCEPPQPSHPGEKYHIHVCWDLREIGQSHTISSLWK